MGKFLRLSNGVPRSFDEGASGFPLYKESLTVVSGSPGAGEIQYPITAGTPITLPNSGNFEFDGSSNTSFWVFLNGARLEHVYDWNESGSGPSYTAITLTFDLEVEDRLDFSIERES